jgi:hypothetical protein
MVLAVSNRNVPACDLPVLSIVYMNMDSLFVIDKKRNQCRPEERYKPAEHLGGPINPLIYLTTQPEARYIMEILISRTTLVVAVFKTPQVEGACMAVNNQIEGFV